MARAIVFITSTTRGIGKGLLELYFSKSNHTIVSANHASVAEDPANVVKEFESKGVDHVDIIIANAGIAMSWPKVSEFKTDEIQKHVEVNIHGSIWFNQAFFPVLKKSR
ncbi:norsolorinic acid reductase-like protein [Hypoxylon fuscum]|nr:norsolorinic acid reductase-like protein [Hypoxylon fuscum]